MTDGAPLDFTHLRRLCDERGMFEHAAGTVRREEHGYCTDDNARLLLVCARTPGPRDRDLRDLALRFVLDAQQGDGRSHNRMARSREWTDAAGTGDWWGRSMWALGVAAASPEEPAFAAEARAGFDRGAQQRSPSLRSMAFAALGAADVLAAFPGDRRARALLVDVASALACARSTQWLWPEDRLTYANAALAEALIAAGAALHSAAHLDRGLVMLRWLLERETSRGHLSVTGTAGRGPGDIGPQFDQQPIEVAAMADACWRASACTGDQSWLRGVALAADWFAGGNDVGLVMHDPTTGGAFDGLHERRVNTNQGAESTLAYVSTMQRATALAPA